MFCASATPHFRSSFNSPPPNSTWKNELRCTCATIRGFQTLDGIRVHMLDGIIEVVDKPVSNAVPLLFSSRDHWSRIERTGEERWPWRRQIWQASRQLGPGPRAIVDSDRLWPNLSPAPARVPRPSSAHGPCRNSAKIGCHFEKNYRKIHQEMYAKFIWHQFIIFGWWTRA